jgi:cytochrome P450 monooxygenase
VALHVQCELLGVPSADRDRFASLLHSAGNLVDRLGADGGRDTLLGYMTELVARKREHPEDDVISHVSGLGLPDKLVGGLAISLLAAGYETTESQIDFGVVLLAAHPDQRDLVAGDPELVPGAVEETLRMGKSGDGNSNLPRYATEDIDIGGVTIRAGDLVLLDFALANFDDRVFDEPERFDVTRAPNPHLSFGHGLWQCIGAPLARVELRAVFTSLLARMPEFRLAVPVEELHTPREEHLTNHFAEVPVTW